MCGNAHIQWKDQAWLSSICNKKVVRIPLNVRSRSNDVVSLSNDPAGNSPMSWVIHGRSWQPALRHPRNSKKLRNVRHLIGLCGR
jgi:hypothetical protein